MNKILIDTTNKHMYFLLLNDWKIVESKTFKHLKFKSDSLVNELSFFLNKNNLSLRNIDELYVTNGPGSFMGIRASLMFAKTFKISTNKKVFVASSFIFPSNGFEDGDFYINASGNTSYITQIKNGNSIEVLGSQNIESNYDYLLIEKNPKFFLSLFEEIEFFNEIEPNYIKNPRIGNN
ncbi:MAG: hypothetical protein K4H23_04110 [Mollicutes bacterium PWAP]|nr:hypothetical protein [Mollicutes bacterium PWAP]